jgi:formylglycine-generating enzyme required for sulfatase activity
MPKACTSWINAADAWPCIVVCLVDGVPFMRTLLVAVGLTLEIYGIASAGTASESCSGVSFMLARSGEKVCMQAGSGQSFKDCPDCPEMVVVPAGAFAMGSPGNEPDREFKSLQAGIEGPQHSVTIKSAFAVGRFAITRNEFEVFIKDGGRKPWDGCSLTVQNQLKSDSTASFRWPGFAQSETDPVVCINWEEAKAYAAWLSKRTGKTYRLLSEAEREYVTRAGTSTPFWWGSAIYPEMANYNGNEVYAGGGQKGVRQQKTMPVHSFKPNPWGVYQVHGNVYEWVEDCWNFNYTQAPTDGSPWTVGNCANRVLRGGCWDCPPHTLRSANRFRLGFGVHYNFAGFRVARTIDP